MVLWGRPIDNIYNNSLLEFGKETKRGWKRLPVSITAHCCWKKPCQRMFVVDRVFEELAEFAWSLVPQENMESCRNDIKFVIYRGVSLQGVDMCNRDPNQNINFKNMRCKMQVPKRLTFLCECSHEQARPDQTLTQRTEKEKEVTAIRHMVWLSFMWLPLFQATKDTCEENEQSRSYRNKARYILLFELHASNYM